jgi:hypothetical protein
MMEGSGARSVLLANGSGCGSGRPKTYGSGSESGSASATLTNVCDEYRYRYLVTGILLIPVFNVQVKAEGCLSVLALHLSVVGIVSRTPLYGPHR